MATRKKPSNRILSPEELTAAGIGMGYTPYDAEPETPPEAPPSPKRGALLDMGTALWQGVKSTGRMLGAAGDTYTNDLPGVEGYAQRQTAAQADRPAEVRALTQELDRLKKANPDGGVLDAIRDVGGAMINNPTGSAQFIAEQVPNSVVALGSGWAGAKAGAMGGLALGGPVGATVGGITGFLGGMFLGNTLLETGGKAIEKAEGGFTGEERNDSIREGAVKGGVVTMVDALTMGAGGVLAKSMNKAAINAGARAEARVLADAGVDLTNRRAIETALAASPALREAAGAAGVAAAKGASTLGSKAAIAGTGLTMETAGEGAGEYLGELAATGKANVYDAVTEAAAGFSQSVPTTAWNMRNASGNELSAGNIATQGQGMQPTPAPAPPTPPAGPLTRAANAGGLGTRLTQTPMADLLGGNVDPLAGQLTADRQAQEDAALLASNTTSLTGSPMSGMLGGNADPLQDILSGRRQAVQDMPSGMAERTGSTDAQPLDLPTADPVANYVDDLRQVNTPAARAFVRDFDAGAITPDDVQQRMARESGRLPGSVVEPVGVRAGRSAQTQEALAAERELAASVPPLPADQILPPADPPQPTINTVQPGDVLNPANGPFKTRVAVERAAKANPGQVIEVPGGFVVRPQQEIAREPVEPPVTAATQAAPGQAPAPASRDAAPASGVPAAPGAGGVQADGVADKWLKSLPIFGDRFMGGRQVNGEATLDQLKEKMDRTRAYPSPNKRDQAEEEADLTAKISALESALPTLRKMDEDDSSKSLSRLMLDTARQELDVEVRSGRMTQAQADAAVERARATGSITRAVDSIEADIENPRANDVDGPLQIGAPASSTPPAASTPAAPGADTKKPGGGIERIKQAAGVVDAPAAAPAPAPLTRARTIEPGPAVVLQNRDRSSAASVAQMNDIAAKPDYLRAGPARVMDSGAPVVFGDAPKTALVGREETVADGTGQRTQTQYMVVEAADLLTSNLADGTRVPEYEQGQPGKLRAVAGNGRAAGLSEAYNRGTANQYRADLLADAQALGIEPAAIEAMRAPVLVRVMSGRDVTADMGDRSNIAGTARLSAVEQASTDARRIDLAALEFDEAGDPTPESVRKFTAGMPTAERGELLNKDGSPTRQAIDRLMAASFKQAYGSDDLVQLYAQATDIEARTVMAALADAAGAMAGLSNAGDLDIRGAVTEAAGMAVNARRRGMTLANMLQNADIETSGEAFVIARFFAENIRSAKKMAEGLRNWANYAAEQAQIARENQTQDGLFGAAPVASRADIFKRIEDGQVPKTDARQPARQEPVASGAERAPDDASAGQAGAATGSAAATPVSAEATDEGLTAPTQADPLAAPLEDGATAVLRQEVVKLPVTKAQTSGPYAQFATGEYVISVQQNPAGPAVSVASVRRMNDGGAQMVSVVKAPSEMLENAAFAALNKAAIGIFNQGSVLAAPTQADIEAQQERTESADKLGDKDQIKRESEVGDTSFMTGFAGDGRQDTTGGLFDAPAKTEPAATPEPPAPEKAIDRRNRLIAERKAGKSLTRPKGAKAGAAFDAEMAGRIRSGEVSADGAEAAGVSTSITWPAHRAHVFSKAPEMTRREFHAALKGRHGMAGQEIDAYYESSGGKEPRVAAPATQETGPFGPILTRYRGDAQGAIQALTQLQSGEAVAALNHPEVGDIDLVWGETSDNPRATGFGLAKLKRWHPEVLGDLQGFISRLSVKQKHNNKIHLQDDLGGRASVQLDWDGERKTWLLTAYEKSAGKGTSADTAQIAARDDTARPGSSTESSVPPAAPDAQADTPKLTQAEAAELMTWQDMGTKDGVKRHILTFYPSKADAQAKTGRMTVATVTKGERSAAAWMVDGDDQTFGPLSLAKKRAMEAGMAKAKTDGFVQMSALEQALGADVLSRPVDRVTQLRKQAEELSAQARKMLDGIAPGQPVMSTRDRNLRERSGEKMRKAAELNAQADALERPAAPAPTAESLNKPRAIDKKRVLTPAGAIRAEARNSDADSSVWYYQGDIKMLPLTASVKVNGQLAAGAADAERLVGSVSAAQKKGWELRSYRAGSLGTVWTLEKDGQFLTKAGLENVNAEQIADPKIPSYGAGYDNMVRGQKEFASALFKWLKTLPKAQRENQSVVSRKMADVLGGWAYIERDKLGLHVRYLPTSPEQDARPARWTHTIPMSKDWSTALQKVEELAGQRFDVAAAEAAPADVPSQPDKADDAGNVAMFSRRTASGNRVPDVVIGHKLGDLNRHPDYEAAKAGDSLAAARIAMELVDDAFVQRVRDAAGRAKLIVPVVSVEASGRNKIPNAVADLLAEKLGSEPDAEIVQVNSPKRTAMDGLDRLLNPPVFEGSVQQGATYVLVDDTVTQGGTFAALASHIADNGAEVMGLVALTGKQYSAVLSLSPDLLSQVRERFQDVEPQFRAATGYGFDALTASEARYLAKHDDAQRVRDRIIAAGIQAGNAGDAGLPPQNSRSQGTTSSLSRGTPTQGIPPKLAQQIVDLIRARWANAPDIVVVADMQDAAVPERVRQEDAKQRSGFKSNAAANLLVGSSVSSKEQAEVAFIDAYFPSNIFSRQSTLNEARDLLKIPFNSGVLAPSANAIDSYAPSIKGGIQSSGLNSKQVSRILDALSVPEKMDSGVNVKAQRLVFRDVFELLQNDQVLDSVIKLIPVDVMNLLTGGKTSPQVLLHDKAMLSNSLSVNGEISVSGQKVADTLMLATAFSGAVVVHAEHIPVLSLKGNSAAAANQRNKSQDTPLINNSDRVLSRESNEIGSARGFFYDGKAYIVASAMRSPADVVETLFHEVLGHFGLRGVFGDALTPILKQLAALRRTEVAAKAREYGLDMSKEADRLQAAEEVLAVMAQTRPELGYVKRAIAAIRAFLRKNVPGFQQMQLTDAEIVAQFILPARAFVERGASKSVVGGVPAMSRSASATDQTLTAAFRKWFGASKVVDADGAPMVVYHGTVKSFDAFDPDAEPYSYESDRGKQFFLDNPKGASDYALGTSDAYGGNANVMPVYLQIQNPRIETVEGSPSEWWDSQPDYMWDMNVVGMGHDGMIVRGEGETMYVTSKPTQIKSATGNNGDFDPKNPDIRFARATPKRSDYAWQGSGKAADGQRYYEGPGFTLAQTAEIDQDDFGDNGFAMHGMMGHAARVVPNTQTFSFQILGAAGESLGLLVADVDASGAIRSVHDIVINSRQGGLGAKIVQHLAANSKQPLRIQDVTNEAEGFWNKLGLGSLDPYRDGNLDWQDAAAYGQPGGGATAPGSDPAVSGDAGRIGDAPQESSQDLSDEDAQGFFPGVRFSRTGNGGAVPGMNGPSATWDAPVDSKWDDYVFKLQDKNIDLKRVTQGIVKWSGALADNINTYLQEELYHGRSAKRVQDFSRMEMEPALKELAAGGYQMEDLEEFMHARHAREANAVMAERNPTRAMIDAARDAAKAEIDRLEVAVEASTGPAQKQLRLELKAAKAELKRWRGAAAFKGTEAERNSLSGMSNQQADAYMAALPAEDARKLGAVAAKMDAIMAQTSDLMVAYGLESQATVDGWAAMYQHYIPLHREDKEDSRQGTGQGFSVKGRETRGRTGSTRKVVDVVAHIAAARERTIVRGEKNRVAQALVGMAVAYPNEDVWKVGPPEYERVFNPSTGKVENRVNPNYKNLPNVVIAKVAGPAGEVREVAVTFNEDNERAVRMASALKNLDAAHIEGMLGTVQKMTRYFAAINTQYNPIFGIVNLVRDVQGAMLNLGTTPIADKKAVVARDAFRALLGIYQDVRATRKGGVASSQWSQLFEQFQQDGGQTGFRALFETTEDRTNELKSILNPDAWAKSGLGKFFTADGKLLKPASAIRGGFKVVMDWLSDYNEAMESGVRLAAYKAALDKGLSREQAASIAKNITVNFNRKGQVGNQVGAVYAFFNAAMQGTARLGEVLVTMDPGQPKTMRLSKFGKRVVAGGVTLGVVQALALAAAGFDDEEPPLFLRERSLIFPTGWTGIGPEKGYVSIPMPLGLHVIPGIGRMASEFALGGFQDPAKHAARAVGMFLDAFNPIGNAGLSMQTLAPTVLDPLVALTENKDWTGKPIARVSFNKDLPGFTQHKDTASVIAKFLAESINTLSGGNDFVAGVLSPTPDQIDYLIGQLTGGVGRELSKVEQTITSSATGEELPVFKVPLVGRFVGNASGKAGESTAFYANGQKLNRLETELKGLREAGNLAEAAELRRENPQARLIVPFNIAERQIQKLRRQKSELIREGASRERVRQIEDRTAAIMARMNRLLRETATN